MPDFEDYSLFLDLEHWDLQVDENGLIKTVEGAYAVSQNVANAVKLFTDDAYYFTDRGIPHFDVELGHKPPYALLRQWIVRTAVAVPGVSAATVEWLQFNTNNKELTGNILLTLESGEKINVAI